MKGLIITLIAFLTVFPLKAQKPDLSAWDPTVVAEANSAKDAGYMTDEEKTVILITNLARKNGPLFTKTILEPYLESQPKSKFTRSLLKELSKTINLQTLRPERDLYEIAKGHALKSGKSGAVGHAGFEKRFKPVMKTYNMVAENCAYGFEKGLDNAIMLLIDEGIKDLGHRKNMLSPHFNSIGVSISEHKKYRFNCVMDFGKR